MRCVRSGDWSAKVASRRRGIGVGCVRITVWRGRLFPTTVGALGTADGVVALQLVPCAPAGFIWDVQVVGTTGNQDTGDVFGADGGTKQALVERRAVG